MQINGIQHSFCRHNDSSFLNRKTATVEISTVPVNFSRQRAVFPDGTLLVMQEKSARFHRNKSPYPYTSILAHILLLKE
jgi:hypothetical protein